MSVAQDFDPSSAEVMLAFYRRLYPFKSIFLWLNHEHSPTKLFTHREFSFTLQGDVYLRYNSFNSCEDLKKQVCSLNPTRFEIGPVYSARVAYLSRLLLQTFFSAHHHPNHRQPRDKKTVRAGAFVPVQRELVFDIDMTDYDSIRTCCSGADICNRCWAFISAAVRVLDSAIRDQFGFQHLLWVYSGRRGIHLWISDKEAMELTDEQRKALVGWLSVIQGGKDMHKKVNVRIGSRALPPSLAAALSPLAQAFNDIILTDQDCFASTDGWEALLHLIPDRDIVERLRKSWSAAPDRSSDEKWSDFKNEVKKTDKSSPHRGTLKAAMEDIILQYTYPRLDAEVSKHRNHLLKAPFCVHPKTGRVCVPVDPKRIEEFDPQRVPTVAQLLRELDSLKADSPPAAGGEHHSDWEKTSLKPYVDLLDKHSQVLMNEVRQSKKTDDMTW